MTSFEYPFLDWLIGLISMIAGVYILRTKRNAFTTLLVWVFYFNFIFFTLVRPRSGGGLPIHFDNFWWATINVIPGFIFAAVMLIHLSNRHKIMKYVTGLIVAYLLFNAVTFVNFPANCFIPRKSIQKEELILTARDYETAGSKKKAQRVYQYLDKYYR